MSDAADRATPGQVEVAKLFFSLPESDGFVLAGAMALIFQGLADRSTEDLDLFTGRSVEAVSAAAQAFEIGARTAGWQVRRFLNAPSLVRLELLGPDEVVRVDIALDAEATYDTVMTSIGPALGPEDLASRKTLALFNRAEARDYVDVHRLAGHFGKERLLELAKAEDAGFSRAVFADMIGAVRRFDVEDVGAEVELDRLTSFFLEWADELVASRD